jgi:tape measure domain-containing protein
MADTIADAFVRIRPDTTGFKEETSSRVGGALGGIARTAGAIAIGYGAFRGLQFGYDAAIKFNSQLQQTHVAFQTILGSSSMATQAIKQLNTFAAQTPFEFQDIIPVAQQLLGTGTKLKDLTPILTNLGNAISATGGSGDQLRLLTLAYTQLATSGTAHLQDLMQVNNAVPGSMGRIAAAMHMTIGQFREAVSAGKVTSEEATTAINKGFEKAFGGGMVAQSHTFAGAMSTIHDVLQNTIATAFRPFFNMLASGADKLAQFLQTGKVTRWSNEIASGVQSAFQHLRILAQFFMVGFRDPASTFQNQIQRAFGAGSFGNRLVFVFTAIGAGMRQLGGLFRTYGPEIEHILGGLITSAFRNLESVAHAVFPVIMRAIHDLTPSFEELARTMGPLGAQLIAAIRPAMPFISNIVVPILEGLAKSLIQTFVIAIKIIIPVISILARALGAIGTAAAPLRPILVILGELIGFAMPGSALRLFGVLGRLGEALPIVGRAFTLLGRVFRPMIEVFGLVIRGVDRLGNAFGEVAPMIGRAMSRAASAVGEGIVRIVSFFGRLVFRLIGEEIRLELALVRGFIRLFVRLGSAVVDGIGSLISSGASLMGRLVSRLIGVLQRIVPEAAGKIADMGSRIARGLRALPAHLIDDAINVGTQLIHGVTQGITNAAGSIKSTLEHKIGSALGSLNPFSPVSHGGELYIANPLVQGTVAALNRGGSGLHDQMTTSMQPAIRDATNRMQRFAHGQATDIGQSVTAGVRQGVNPLGGMLGDAIVTAAHAAINHARSALGISSPSSVFAERVGRPIADGIVHGMGGLEHALAQRVSSAAQSAFGAVGGPQGSAAIGYNQRLGYQMMLAHGWPASQWGALQALWTRESGWNANAVNASSGAYGIPQSLGHGHPYNLGDARAQIAWGLDYIAGRYGSPAAAWAHEEAIGWYQGGGVAPGYPGEASLGVLHGGEVVFTPDQLAVLSRRGISIGQVVVQTDNASGFVSELDAIARSH